MSAQVTELPRYQGWTNYPTWAVNLWLSNDEGLYLQAREMAERARAEAPDHSNVPEIWTVEEAARFTLADSLEEFVGELAGMEDEASFRVDILGWALGLIDWHEIADAWLED